MTAYTNEAKSRGLSCGVTAERQTVSASTSSARPNASQSGECRSTNLGPCSEQQLCEQALRNINGVKSWVTTGYRALYAGEARRRGLTCGIGGSNSRSTSSSSSSTQRNTTSTSSNSRSRTFTQGQINNIRPRCLAMGYQPGTDALAFCIQTELNNEAQAAAAERAERQRRRERLADAWSELFRSPTRCYGSTFGSSWSANCY